MIIVRFAAITLNLGPTFLSGTMAANMNQRVRWDLPGTNYENTLHGTTQRTVILL